jgi:hypothetical protein
MEALNTVGIVEEISIRGRKEVRAMAVFDTGARMTSVDVRLAARAQLGPIVKTTKISAASTKGQVRRPVVEASIDIKGRAFDALVNIQDREHMTFPIIIGRNIIRGNFVVDPRRNHETYESMTKEKQDAGRKQPEV